MKSYFYHHYSSKTITEAIKQAKNVILPMGAVEAHSDHLPLDTDNILVDYYALALAKETNSLVLPTINFGSVWSLSEAPGSINIGLRTMIDLIKDIIYSLAKNQVPMVTLVSSHFGNIDACKLAAREAYEELGIKVIYMTYPHIKNHLDHFEKINDHDLYLHACEVETSMVLHVNPSKVDMSKAQKGTLKVPEETSYTPTKWTDFSDNYIMGDARAATEEKGQILFEKVIQEASQIILKEKEK